jgi:hypothetical protein
MGAQIKAPTRFPIIPLKETLARARKEVKSLQDPDFDLKPTCNEDPVPVFWPKQRVVVEVHAQGHSIAEEMWKLTELELMKHNQNASEPEEPTIIHDSDRDCTVASEMSELPNSDRIKECDQKKRQANGFAMVDSFGRTRAAAKRIRDDVIDADIKSKNGRY